HGRARSGARGPGRACRTRAGGERPPARGGVRDQHACAGARDGAARGRRGGRQCDRGGVGRGRRRRRRASGPPARRRPPGGERMTANRLVTIYSRALAIGGSAALGAALILDPRWTGQPLELLGLLVAALLLRGGQVPLSKYS